MNKLVFSKLEIENFRSIKDKVTLDIKEGLHTIEGVNNDENSNNGAGKSTLVSAFYWALTGNTITNEVLSDEVINFKTGKNCRVSVYIQSDSGEIKITRTRKDDELGNNLQLEVDGQNLSCHKISDTQERINNIIKLPLDLLKNTLIITSNMESAFSELTPAQRVQVLENVRDYTIWNNVRDNANKDIKDYNKLIKELELDISNLTGSKSSFSKILQDTEKDKEIYIADYTNKNYPKTILNCEKETDKYNIEIQELLKSKENLQNQIISSNNQDLLDKLNQIKDEGVELNKQIVTIENDKKHQEQEIVFKKRELNNKLSIIESWFTNDVCPTCKRKLERTGEQIDEKTVEKKTIEMQLNNYDSILENVVKKAENDVNEIKKQVENKRTEYNELNKIYQAKLVENNVIPNKIRDLDSKIREITDLANRVNIVKQEAQAAINLYDARIKTFDENSVKYKNELVDLDSKINQKQGELKELENKRRISTFFYDLLGPKGELRPYLLKQDVEYLNKFIQHYINTFFIGTSVNLKLDGNTIKIEIKTNDGIEKSVSSLSGGEKKRLNLSIQLALYDLMQSVSQTNFNTLWLDEVETQMDPIGCQQLIDIIEEKSNEIETVYWITNNDMVKENVTNKIVCEKTAGTTKITII